MGWMFFLEPGDAVDSGEICCWAGEKRKASLGQTNTASYITEMILTNVPGRR